MRDRLISTILFIIMTLNGIDVFVDIGLEVPLWHILQEATLVILSAVAAIWLVLHIRKKSNRLRYLASELDEAEVQIYKLNSKISDERKHFSGVIKAQFEDWGLTLTEQQVSMLLLKGLSLKEVAAVRDTKEATVRQQASSIYAKSGLVGRHEFSAWFLEDFMNPG